MQPGGTITNNQVNGPYNLGMKVSEGIVPASLVSPLVSGNQIEGASIGLEVDGTLSTVTGNSVSALNYALSFFGTTSANDAYAVWPFVYLNDFLSPGQILSPGCIDMAQLGVFTSNPCNATPPNIQLVGNYWGDSCSSQTGFQIESGCGPVQSSAPATTINDSTAWQISVAGLGSPGSVSTSVGPISNECILAGGPPGCQTILCAETAPTTALLFNPNPNH